MQGKDLCELRRHAYSNTVDPYSIKQLVKRVFPSCQCKQAKTLSGDSTSSDVGRVPQPLGAQGRLCAGHEVSLSIESTVQKFDVKEECILTLMCYLEGWVEMKGTKKDMCNLKCYGGPRQLRALAQKVPAVAAATARVQGAGQPLKVFSSTQARAIIALLTYNIYKWKKSFP